MTRVELRSVDWALYLLVACVAPSLGWQLATVVASALLLARAVDWSRCARTPADTGRHRRT
jgi:hypothetical protein